MSGGLLQLVASGVQDTSLTLNPQITFFKKAYRRHTNFSLEMKTLTSDQQADWGDVVSFSIGNSGGDLLHRCFIQINIPSLTFTDALINNSIYTSWKSNYLNTINIEITKWQTLYTNLKNYVSIELLLYQQLKTLFLSDNITLNNIKETVTRFNNKYLSQKNLYINLVDIVVFNKINISGYLLSINKLLTYNTTIINDNYISLTTIQNNLSLMVTIIYDYLNYYHSNWKQTLTKYTQMNNGNINFAWNTFLAHFYFSQFELDIGGQIIEKYSSDQLHIYQTHHLLADQLDNYNKMIGNIDDLTLFNNNTKPAQTIYCPLLFWFCKKSGAALPIVGLRNTAININLTISPLKNILYFRDWEIEYNEITKLTLLLETYPLKSISGLIYTSYTYDKDKKQITYLLPYINNISLSLIYPVLLPADITFIITTFGTNNILGLKEWIIFKNNLPSYTAISNKIGGYDSFIDYNLLLNLIPLPNISLITEYIYLDDLEREKFASSKLEYVIETFQENIFDVHNLPLFNGEISIDRPNKYLKWFIQPKTFLNGLSEYGKVYSGVYDFTKYFTNYFFNKQIITLNQVELLNTHIDGTYYQYVTAFKCLNGQLPEGIYMFTFSLFPEESQPSGAANLSVIKEKKIRYEMNSNFLKEYFTSQLNTNQLNLQTKVLGISYNFFVVNNGIGRLVFAN